MVFFQSTIALVHRVLTPPPLTYNLEPATCNPLPYLLILTMPIASSPYLALNSICFLINQNWVNILRSSSFFYPNHSPIQRLLTSWRSGPGIFFAELCLVKHLRKPFQQYWLNNAYAETFVGCSHPHRPCTGLSLKLEIQLYYTSPKLDLGKPGSPARFLGGGDSKIDTQDDPPFLHWL